MISTVRAQSGGFALDLASPRARQLVKLSPPVRLRHAPCRPDPAPLLEPQQRRIQRSLVERQRAAGDLLNALGEPEAVLRPHSLERAQHHQVERALQNIGFRVFCRHPREV